MSSEEIKIIIHPRWTTIKSHPMYDVSTNGKVKNRKTNKELKPSILSDGYHRVKLYNHGTPKSFYIHILVARYFIHNPHNHPTVDHIDRNKSNNNILNLRWASHSMQSSNTRTVSVKLRGVAMIDKDSLTTIQEFQSMKEAEKEIPGASQRGISAVCRGKRKTHAGYVWKYTDTESMKGEEWRDIPNYPGMKVSNMGRIKHSTGRITTGFNHNEYKRVHLMRIDDVRKHLLVHRLVALNFIPNPYKLKCVNHKNGKKDDNRMENLEWTSHSENSLHAYRTGLNSNVRGVKRICKTTNQSMSFRSISDAARKTSINLDILNDVLRGRSEQPGYTWIYNDYNS